MAISLFFFAHYSIHGVTSGLVLRAITVGFHRERCVEIIRHIIPGAASTALINILVEGKIVSPETQGVLTIRNSGGFLLALSHPANSVKVNATKKHVQMIILTEV